MPEVLTEVQTLSPEAQSQFAEKAAELKLKTPELPFKSICMDGQPYRTTLENGIYPVAAQALESRLKYMGKAWSHQGVLEFIDAEGKFWVARDVMANRQALKDVGFEYIGSEKFVTFTNGMVPDGANRELYREILTTPEDEQERMIWAVRDSDLEQFNYALEHGATIKGIKDVHGMPLVFSAINRGDDNPGRDPIVRRLLKDSEYVAYNGETILHAVSNSSYTSCISILPDLIKTGVDPLVLNDNGVPAFLKIQPGKDSARDELKLIANAMLTSGLAADEKKLIQAQVKLIDDAIISDQRYKAVSAKGDDPPVPEGEKWWAGHIVNTIKSVWEEAHRFADKRKDPGRIPNAVKTFLEPLTDPKRVPKFMETIVNYKMGKFITVNDLVQEFTAHVVLPLVVMEYSRQLGIPVTDDALNEFGRKLQQAGLAPGGYADTYLLSRLIPVVKEALLEGRSIDKIIGLNEAWHDAQVAFPDALKPIKAAGEWYSLTGEKTHKIPELSDVTLHVLTNDNELEYEGKALDHCVYRNGYASKCLKAESHIISVRKDGEEQPLSTIEATWDGRTFGVLQNRSYRNGAAPSEARIAEAWLKEQLETGKIRAARQLGETEESKKINSRPGILRTIGFEINPGNINAAFREYCENSKRRAREYNPKTKQFDILSRRTELIAGSLDTILHSDSFQIMNAETGRPKKITIAHKDLPAEKWFEVSGLRDKAMAATLQPLIDKELHARREKEIFANAVVEQARNFSAALIHRAKRLKEKREAFAQTTAFDGEICPITKTRLERIRDAISHAFHLDVPVRSLSQQAGVVKPGKPTPRPS